MTAVGHIGRVARTTSEDYLDPADPRFPTAGTLLARTRPSLRLVRCEALDHHRRHSRTDHGKCNRVADALVLQEFDWVPTCRTHFLYLQHPGCSFDLVVGVRDGDRWLTAFSDGRPSPRSPRFDPAVGRTPIAELESMLTPDALEGAYLPECRAGCADRTRRVAAGETADVWERFGPPPIKVSRFPDNRERALPPAAHLYRAFTPSPLPPPPPRRPRPVGQFPPPIVRTRRLLPRIDHPAEAAVRHDHLCRVYFLLRPIAGQPPLFGESRAIGEAAAAITAAIEDEYRGTHSWSARSFRARAGVDLESAWRASSELQGLHGAASLLLSDVREAMRLLGGGSSYLGMHRSDKVLAWQDERLRGAVRPIVMMMLGKRCPCVAAAELTAAGYDPGVTFPWDPPTGLTAG